MGVNKVVCGAVAVMDISDSTVTEDTLSDGSIAYGANGERITGKMKVGITPSGVLNILYNGTFDVTNYASVNVNVPSNGVTLPDGAVVVQKVLAAQASTNIGSGYSLSVTYGDNVEINNSIALAFTGTTKNLSNISNATDFSVLLGKYVRTGSSYGATTGTFYYIPEGATFTVGGQSMSKTLTCDKAQKVSMQKVSV